ncbi:hypothetical protein COL5a_010391 [Colletotrichum fioriniae]|uniref:uncharacterized protein n=1 Tax=Colletotrichum fioriniae TaxID=710243 RepID=UPI0032DBB43B|nr:hypothetical protein COL5a_010391 [Colletotrichum fioriniae]KAJ3945719.1 hypothetical protein N0V96_004058 [Colletotrichum fioriniae]
MGIISACPTMPPKVTNANAFNTAPGNNTKKGLSHSIHSPQADDGPQIRPTHFIVREGSPGAIVPVIPVDLLPDYVTIVGLSRMLAINDTTGMSNLGTFAKPQGHLQLQFVSPAHDHSTEGPESPDSGCHLKPQRPGPDAAKISHGTGKQPHIAKGSGVGVSSKLAASQPTPKALGNVPLLAPPPPLPPRVLDWAEDDTESVSTDDFSSAELSALDSSSKSSSSSRNKQKPPQRAPTPATGAIKEKSDAEIAERMLELGRVQQQAAARNHHHHPAQALKTMAAASSHSSDGSTSTGIAAGAPKPTPPKPTAGKQKVVRPDGSLCRHWCQTGQCSWGNECRYTHQMPLTLEGLADVNLTELPSWWRKQAGLPAEGTIDPRIFAVATVAPGLKKNSLCRTALGVVNVAPPPLESSRKATKVKPGKVERKMARELRGVQFGIERAQATMMSPVVAVGSKKQLGVGRVQSQTMGIQQLDEVVEKLVDI